MNIKFKNPFSKKESVDGNREIVRGNRITAGPATIRQIEETVRGTEKTMLTELSRGYDLIKKYPRSVSILGSARLARDNKYYKHAESLARRIVKELKYAVVTGGGPGIMEAANKGAYEAGGASIGFTIELPKEQQTNKYVTESADFEYFFSRKTLLFFAAECYIYYPGGFGTLDELFSVIGAIQTGKMPRTPVILVGKAFWQPLMDLIQEKLLVENHTIDDTDMSICTITDSEDQIIATIKNAPYRQE
ncbi:MAG: TIGR00730 family Rossman fold protein [Patescibacteria group bacterium]|nr:TIGR00730 family Rossman fold protein [Patescibacteria group bacterium]MDE1945858.1 TIGR00730 family Rossman fold protein [Patescibacteria group bacterium]